METIAKQPQQKFKKKDNKLSSVYSRCLLTRNIILPITVIGKNIKEVLEENLKANFEEKCVVEGYVKPNSSNIITFSSGLIYRGNQVSFEVVFECEICFPVEGMLISCVAKNITKAGIRAESSTEVPSPIVVFIAKDHNYNNTQFSEIKEGDKFTAKVIGQRFELNDKYVSVIAELSKPKMDKEYFGKSKETVKPRLVISD
jgi:DNA-directed RNA polymerase subunit E'/Rpb7